MASPAHCAYCIDVLAASLDGREPTALEAVLASWDEYVVATAASAKPIVDKGIPALSRLAAAGVSESSVSSSSSGTTSASLSSAPSGVSTPDTSVSSLPSTGAAPPTAEYPLFVTWNTLLNANDDDDDDEEDDDHQLRGCIGTFEPYPLSEGLAEFSLTAALEDTRFRPISSRELPTLQCAVTLLTDFEDAADVADWTIGEHGLRISFTHHGRRYGATYLPDVAAEQGWTKDETLVSLMRKAGWMGSRSRWRDVDVKVVRYRGKKASLTYGEYQKWAAWREGEGAK